MSGKITVYAIRADKKDCGYKTAVSNSLKNLQNFVGGYIEVVRLFPDLAIICNEEGRILNLPYNCKILGCPFYGDLLIVGVNGEEFTDLPEPWKNVNRIRAELGVR